MAERGGDGESAVFAFLSNPYFIGIAGALLWLALIVLIMVLWYNKWRRGKKNGGITGLSPFIKINDGSVLNRDPLWIDSQLNTAQRNLLMNGHITGNGECTGYSKGVCMEDLCAGTSGYGSQPDIYNQQCMTQQHGGELPPAYHDINMQHLMNAHHMNTIQRQQQHSQHQYAHLCSQQNLSTFYNGGGSGGTDTTATSPYATTTLVMAAHARNLHALQQQSQSARQVCECQRVYKM